MPTPQVEELLADIRRSFASQQTTQSIRHIVSSCTDRRDALKKLLAAEALTAWQTQRLKKGRASLRWGKYILVDEQRIGGLGKVLLARHHHMKRLVSLKQVAIPPEKRDDVLPRMQQQARHIASLNHHNLLHLYDFIVDATTCTYVLEFVRAANISSTNVGVSPSDACIYIKQAAAGLQHIHESNLAHGALSSDCLLLDQKGVVKIAGLGIRTTGASHRPLGNLRELDLADLGWCLCGLLAGHQANSNERSAEYRISVWSRLMERQISSNVSSICRRMVDRNAKDRFQSAAEMVAALSKISETKSRGQKHTIQSITHDHSKSHSGLSVKLDSRRSLHRLLKQVLLGSGFVGTVLTVSWFVLPTPTDLSDIGKRTTPVTTRVRDKVARTRAFSRPKPQDKSQTIERTAISAVAQLIQQTELTETSSVPRPITFGNHSQSARTITVSEELASHLPEVEALGPLKTNPFQNSATVVSLPSHPDNKDAITKKLLIGFELPAPVALSLNLLGGDLAHPIKRFSLREGVVIPRESKIEEDYRAWDILLSPQSGRSLVTAKLSQGKEGLSFRWLTTEKDTNYLANCVVHLRAASHEHLIFLRKSVRADPIPISIGADRSFVNLPWLPKRNMVFLEVLGLSEGWGETNCIPDNRVSAHGQSVFVFCGTEYKCLGIRVETKLKRNRLQLNASSVIRLPFDTEPKSLSKRLLENMHAVPQKAAFQVARLKKLYQSSLRKPAYKQLSQPDRDVFREQRKNEIRRWEGLLEQSQAFFSYVDALSETSCIYFRVLHRIGKHEVILAETEPPRWEG